ncbi:MAG: efflux transporter outer membrane subunit [Thermodesulfobacteriota bacterium]|nr:efflux transporter outer membrane subunit [Thermodesulfobacteriota bacterium]
MVAKLFCGKPLNRKFYGFLSILLIFSVIPAFTGCVPVGPNYIKMEPEAPEKWQSQLQRGLTPYPLNHETLAMWWTILNDEILSSLEERAVKGSLDLKEARARVCEARARRGISQAGFFPLLDASSSAAHQRTSKNSNTGDESKFYDAGFDAGWELDIFGGIERLNETAQANLDATIENFHDVLVSLLAEVALNYVEVRTYQARLAVALANVRSQEDTWRLNQSRYKAGIINELAVQQSLYNIQRTHSQIPALQTGLAAAKNRIAVLLGQNPGSVHQELFKDMPIPVLPENIAVGVPAETLRQRPDIRYAERVLAARTAMIGQATAELYPKFSLSGTIGLESLSPGDLLTFDSRKWSIGPGIVWNIFDAGAIRQNIKVQSALQEQALIHYETTVLRALEEVENVLVAYVKEQCRCEFLTAATVTSKRAYELAMDQYNAGIIEFTSVLDAQRSLQSFQDQLAQCRGAVTSNLIRLYKALGGGWNYTKS